MRYLVVDGPQDKEKAAAFVKEVGFPIFAKPNIGVGAGDSHALRTQEDFDSFFNKRLPEPYILEEFIEGSIVSFDGVCDSQGNVVFATTDHFPTPIDIIVNEGLDHYYVDIPFQLKMTDINAKEFEKVGRQVVKAFGIRKRVFHIEFFVLNKAKKGLGKKGDFVALECNMRAPGGYTPDLMDYGNSVSIYDIYADVIAYDENRQDMTLPKYYAVGSHRKDSLRYAHSLDEVYQRFGHAIKMSGRYPKHIAEVMGNVYVYAAFKTLDEAMEFDAFTREKAD